MARFLSAVWLCAWIGVTSAASLDLAAFQRPDGAITVHAQGSHIDPYFGAKALLVALDLGLDISRPAQSWIDWMLARQHSAGRFERWCVEGGALQRCGRADADDAAIGTWMELLYRLAPPTTMPETWRASLLAAERYLGRLATPAGYYVVSTQYGIGLLMDNAEVLTGFVAAARHAKTAGGSLEARQRARQAEDLAQAIERTFWQGTRWRNSTQTTPMGGFYPDAAAQLYPRLAGMMPPAGAASFADWLAEHGPAWRAQAEHDYPWGLVAMAAWQAGDANTAACWLARSGFQRDNGRWNVLEEAVYQGLAMRLAGVACVAGEGR